MHARTLRVIGVIALLIIALTRQGTLAANAPSMTVRSFTTATNASLKPGMIDLYPFLGGLASALVPVPAAGSVTIEKSKLGSNAWTISDGSQSVTIPCGAPSSPAPAQAAFQTAASFTPSVAQLIERFRRQFTQTSPTKIIVETKEEQGVFFDGNYADGYLTTITNWLDPQGKDTQITQIISIFRPTLRDPVFPCLIALQAFGLNVTLPNDYAFQQVVGTMLDLEAATVNPPANFMMSGDKLPVGEFLLFGQVMLYGIDTSPGSGSVPDAVYTIENGNVNGYLSP